MILPNFIYLSYVSTLEEKYVNYQISDIYNTIVLHLGDNTRLNNILSKYYDNWTLGDKYKSYNNQLFSYFINTNNVLDKDKTALGARVFKYGYVDNLPYNWMKAIRYQEVKKLRPDYKPKHIREKE